jgi:hypothetical protein
MKFLLTLCFALSLTAAATAADDPLGPAIAGRRNVYFRVVLEKANGVDMRENMLPKDVIKAVEKQGAPTRPVRTKPIVSYWVFFKNGEFSSSDVVGAATQPNLSYEQLEAKFGKSLHDGPTWNREGENLIIGEFTHSFRVLTANDPVTGGRKGEVEIAVLNGKDKVYYFFGTFVEK